MQKRGRSRFEISLVLVVTVAMITSGFAVDLISRSAEATTYHTIVIDGINDFDSDEFIESDSGVDFYLTWDADYIYIGFDGVNVQDTDNLAVTFDTMAGGTFDPIPEYGVVAFANYSMDFLVGLDEFGIANYYTGISGHWVFVDNVFGDPEFGFYVGNSENPYSEMRIPRDYLGYATSMNVTAWVVSNDATIVSASFPTANPTGSGVVLSHAYVYPNLTSGISPNDFSPPTTWLIIGEPHFFYGNQLIVSPDTPLALIASDVEGIPPSAQAFLGISATFYSIDGSPPILYTDQFNLSGLAPNVGHWITYWSVDTSGNIEDQNILYDVYVDYTSPQLIAPSVEPVQGEEGTLYHYIVTYEDDGPFPGYFRPPGGGVVIANQDEHPRKAVDYEGNEHIVWMSNRDGRWEIYYKVIDPDGTIDAAGKLTDKVLINDTRISDLNGTKSMYPSIVLEPHEQVYLNDTIYNNRYGILAAPVRYYIDQEQRLENNKVLVNTTQWQVFQAGIAWWNITDEKIWVDILVTKNSTQYGDFTNPLNLTVYDPQNNIVLFSQSIPAGDILEGTQWLAFYGRMLLPLIPGNFYYINVSSLDPYEWHYCFDNANNPYEPGNSSLDPNNNVFIDFAFIERYDWPEIRFKHEMMMMRDLLLTQGFTDADLKILTVPYWITDSQSKAWRWRIPGPYIQGHVHGFPAPGVRWQSINYDFTEAWIDGDATHDNLWEALNSTRSNATENDLIFIELRDHGGGRAPNFGGRPNGSPGDPRIANDELVDGHDESFCTYADPNEGFNPANYWFDDEIDIELDKMSYRHMVIEIDACYSGGYIPDLSGKNRIILTVCREDEVSYSYVYRFYERIDIAKSPNADLDKDGRISVEEAHEYALKQIPKEFNCVCQKHPQIDIWDYAHVVWADQRDDPNLNDTNDIFEIYYSKLGSLVNYSASDNGVDLTKPDWRVSLNDGVSSGRVVLNPVDGRIATFIEHPDIDIDSKLNLSIVWSDKRDGQWEVYYQMQDNAVNGTPTTLIDDTRISELNASNSQCPAVSVGNVLMNWSWEHGTSGNLSYYRMIQNYTEQVHIVWQDDRDGNWEIYYQRVNPYTGDFVVINDTRVTSGINDSIHNSDAVDDDYNSTMPDIDVEERGGVYIVFMDDRPDDPGPGDFHIDNYWEIYTLSLGTIGNTLSKNWEKRQSDFNDPSTWYGSYTGNVLQDGYSMYPRIVVGKETYITWHDDRDGNWEIYYSEMSNGCNNPNEDVRVTNDASSDMYPDIAINRSDKADVVWQTLRNNNWDIYTKSWNQFFSIIVVVNGIPHHLFRLDPSDDDPTDGIVFVYGMPLDYGWYNFSFYAFNGLYNATTNTTANAPIVNDTIPPAEILDLRASNYTTSTITLTWTAPGDNGDEGIATLYDIRYAFQAITNESEWENATQVSGEPVPSLPGTVQSMTVTNLEPGRTYYFAIKTGDEVPNWSDLSNTPSATTLYSIALQENWNLISIPVMPMNTSIESVLASIVGNYSIVWTYNAFDESDPWKMYNPSGPPWANDLTSINNTMGLWISMLSPDLLIINGTTPNLTFIGLKDGWNLVGYPSLTFRTPENALSSIAGNYSVVWAYFANDTADPWKKYSPQGPPWANDLTYILPKFGYWIYATTESTWSVEV